MNFKQLKKNAERQPGSHPETGRFLNDGLKELAKVSQKRSKNNITFTSGAADIPATCLIPLKILWDKYPLGLADANMYISTSTSDPIEFAIVGNQIVLDTEISETQKLLCIPRPTEMTDDDDTADLAECDNALIAYARWKIYEDLEHKEKAGMWEQVWYKEKAEWLKLHEKINKRPRRVKAASW